LERGIELNLKFFADRMLGRLAKKLRILGFDTLYFSDIPKNEIFRLCKKEDRILLTRDKQIAKRAWKEKVAFFFLKSDKWYSQLKAVKDRFNISLEDCLLFSRCSECNGFLEHIDKEKIKNKIPEYVYLTNNEFLMCPKCGKVYWRGTHTENIMNDLNKILRGSNDESRT